MEPFVMPSPGNDASTTVSSGYDRVNAAATRSVQRFAGSVDRDPDDSIRLYQRSSLSFIPGASPRMRKACLPAAAAALLAFGGGAEAQPPPGFALTLIDVDGQREVLGELPAAVYAPRLSPDGRRIAFETRDAAGARLWTADLRNLGARQSLPPVVGPVNWAPMWTLDGQRLVFIVSGPDRPDAIYWRPADGSGEAEHLIDTRAGEGWYGDGAQLRFLSLKPNNDYGISLLDIASRTVTQLVDLPGSAQHSSSVSPDGRWLAYASNETGRYEVWIEPLPPTGARHRVTRDGGSHPLWLPDGRALYFDRDRRMFRLDVDTNDLETLREPVPLPIEGFVQAEYRRQFDLLPGGRQFLVLMPVATN
jgi:dipeptidyl aminopeptidase/acylaminoacyl peptidase